MDSILQNLSYQTESLEHGPMAILMTVSLSLILSSLISFTYQQTTRKINKPVHFLQSIILISIVAATVMQAVGDSLSKGLGMLGALAIIRFRTRLEDPRNITFMFASLAVGISCGVHVYNIALIGTIFFCAIAYLLSISPLGNQSGYLGELKLLSNESPSARKSLSDVLNSFCSGSELIRYRQSEIAPAHKELVYQIKLKDIQQAQSMVSAIEAHPDFKQVGIKFERDTQDL